MKTWYSFPDEEYSFSDERMAEVFEVPLHMIKSDLPAGYWERELARSIARRSLRRRLRSWRRRIRR